MFLVYWHDKFQKERESINYFTSNETLSGWGNPIENTYYSGCPDKSDIVINMTVNDDSNKVSCGDKYFYHDWTIDKTTKVNVNWKWFECHKTEKCIHQNTRCDLHPHPACIYENKKGEMVAEDEENCLSEYKKKGLVGRSASFKCISPFHHKNSQAIRNNLFFDSLNDAQYERESTGPYITWF